MKIRILTTCILLFSFFASNSFCDINYTPFVYDRLKNRTEKFLLARIIIGSPVVNQLTFANIMEDKRLNPKDTLRVLFLNAHDIPKHQVEAIGKLYDDDHSIIYNLQTESDKIQAAFFPNPLPSNKHFVNLTTMLNDQLNNPRYASDIIKLGIVEHYRYSCSLDLDVRLLKSLKEISRAHNRLINSPHFHSNENYLDYPLDPYTFRDKSEVGQTYLDAYYRGQYTRKELMSEKPDFKLNYDAYRHSFQWDSITVEKKSNNTFSILSPETKAPLILRNEMEIPEFQKIECTIAGIHYLDEKNPEGRKESTLNEQIERAKELIQTPQEDELHNLENFKIIETLI